MAAHNAHANDHVYSIEGQEKADTARETSIFFKYTLVSMVSNIWHQLRSALIEQLGLQRCFPSRIWIWVYLYQPKEKNKKEKRKRYIHRKKKSTFASTFRSLITFEASRHQSRPLEIRMQTTSVEKVLSVRALESLGIQSALVHLLVRGSLLSVNGNALKSFKVLIIVIIAIQAITISLNNFSAVLLPRQLNFSLLLLFANALHSLTNAKR